MSNKQGEAFYSKTAEQESIKPLRQNNVVTGKTNAA